MVPEATDDVLRGKEEQNYETSEDQRWTGWGMFSLRLAIFLNTVSLVTQSIHKHYRNNTHGLPEDRAAGMSRWWRFALVSWATGVHLGAEKLGSGVAVILLEERAAGKFVGYSCQR